MDIDLCFFEGDLNWKLGVSAVCVENQARCTLVTSAGAWFVLNVMYLVRVCVDHAISE